MIKKGVALLFIILLVFGLREGFSSQPTYLPKKEILIGKVKLSVEWANSEQSRKNGLMFRTHLAEDTGMLFVFQKEQKLSFWMKNTFIPLDIGFFDRQKKLLEVVAMDPVKSVMQKNIPQYQSQKKALYALEVKRGWFKKHGLRPGVSFRVISP